MTVRVYDIPLLQCLYVQVKNSLNANRNATVIFTIVSVVFVVCVVTRKCTIFTYFRFYSDSTKSINPNSE